MDEGESHKTVYAHYGLAMYWAQCVEQSIIQLLVFFKFFPEQLAAYSTQEKWEKEFDDFNEAMSAKTMGRLVERLLKLNIIEADVAATIESATKIRNFIAHTFFVQNALSFTTEQGRNAMIDELQGLTNYLRDTDGILMKIVMDTGEKYGMTPEYLKEIEEQMLQQEFQKSGPNKTGDEAP